MRRRQGAGTMTERKPRATYDDLLEVPDIMVAEILDGELYASPHPTLRHSLVFTALGARLVEAYDLGRDGPGGWWILHQPEMHFGEDVLVPDLAGWRRDRLPQIPDAPAISLSPDWICEVLTPPTERIDRVHKLPIYTREGVKHVWLINPQARTLEAYRRAQTGWSLLSTHGGEEPVRAEPFEAVAIDLSELWGET